MVLLPERCMSVAFSFVLLASVAYAVNKRVNSIRNQFFFCCVSRQGSGVDTAAGKGRLKISPHGVFAGSCGR